MRYSNLSNSLNNWPSGFFIKENMMFKNFTANWRTTVIGLIPLVAYGLKYAGVWPESMPLPPLDEVWPFLQIGRAHV